MVKREYSRAFGSSQPSAYKKKKTTTMVPRSIKPKRFILGKTQRATLRYSEAATVSGSAVQGAIGNYVFSANGCFDPNITGIGHQPRGFDQLMSLYDHYTVTKSTIKVRFINNNNSRPYVGIVVRDDNTTLATVESVNEYGDKVLSARPLSRVSTNDEAGIGNSTVLSTSCVIGSFLGRGDVTSDPDLKGSVVANPAEQVYYHVIVGDPHGSGATNVSVLVTVTYEVIFHEPKQPTSS